MPAAHRDTDARICGATTIVTGQSTVYVNGLLWAVDGDPNTDGGGNLIAGSRRVFINGKAVVNHSPDSASADDSCPAGAPHCAPATAGGSPNVNCGD